MMSTSKTIRRINAVSAGSVAAIITLITLYIIFIPFIILMALGGIPEDSALPVNFFGGSLVFLFFVPLIYAGFAFLMGLVYAAIYNWTFKLHKGYKVEFLDSDDELSKIGNP